VQIEIGHWIETLQAGFGAVPAALVAMVLLGGPTAAWLLYRFVVQPRASRYRGVDPSAMWICPSCRSVNDMRFARCYRCDAAQDDVEVIDPHPAGPIRLTPVGPGLDLGGAGHGTGGPRPITQIGRAPDVWAMETDDWGAEVEEDRAALADVAAMTEVVEAPGRRRSSRPPPMPVTPAPKPAVARPRRAVVAGPSHDPDDSPAA
jgi:hypothetical protein